MFLNQYKLLIYTHKWEVVQVEKSYLMKKEL